MEIAQTVANLFGMIALAFLVWWVKAHISNRVEEHAKKYGEIDAKIERLPDLTTMTFLLRESNKALASSEFSVERSEQHLGYIFDNQRESGYEHHRDGIAG